MSTSDGLHSHLGVFEPLIHLLQKELDSCGQTAPTLRAQATPQEFTHWFLAVIRRLDAHVASEQDYPPMARDELEFICRCALTGATLEDAVQLCVRYLDTHTPRGGRLQLLNNGKEAQVVLDTLRKQPSSARSFLDIIGIFAFHQLFQWLTDRILPLHQVRIGPVPRDDVLPFLKLFRAPVLAGGKDYSISFDARALAWPVVRTSRQFNSFFALWPCNVFTTRQTALSQQVQTLLAAALRSGEAQPTQEELATDLGMSLSTFRRTLQNEGQSYRKLREDVSREVAAELLQRHNLSVGAIATQLGFSDAGAFRRAFKKWHRQSPTDWRRANT